MKLFKAIQTWAAWRSNRHNKAELIELHQQRKELVGKILSIDDRIKKLERR